MKKVVLRIGMILILVLMIVALYKLMISKRSLYYDIKASYLNSFYIDKKQDYVYFDCTVTVINKAHRDIKFNMDADFKSEQGLIVERYVRGYNIDYNVAETLPYISIYLGALIL